MAERGHWLVCRPFPEEKSSEFINPVLHSSLFEWIALFWQSINCSYRRPRKYEASQAICSYNRLAYKFRFRETTITCKKPSLLIYIVCQFGKLTFCLLFNIIVAPRNWISLAFTIHHLWGHIFEPHINRVASIYAINMMQLIEINSQLEQRW